MLALGLWNLCAARCCCSACRIWKHVLLVHDAVCSAASAGQGGKVKVEPLEGDAAGGEAGAKRHLVVLVNGLFGSVDNWDVVVECLQVCGNTQSPAMTTRLLAVFALAWDVQLPAKADKRPSTHSAPIGWCPDRRSWGRRQGTTC